MKRIVLLTILVSLLQGCLPLDDYNYQGWRGGSWHDETSSLIFQTEFTNHAWGYQHNGWMLGRSGEVKRFLKTASWVFPDSLGYISEADMKKNLAQCDSVIARLDPRVVDRYSQFAVTCNNGPYSAKKLVMVDAGERINAFYLYDSHHRRYKRVLLNMTGDWSQENLAPKAKEVVDWMGKIKG